jgi:Holliday junction resolvase RusA-like endonuclease
VTAEALELPGLAGLRNDTAAGAVEEAAPAARVTFDVVGQPAPQGSKKGWYNPKTKRVHMSEQTEKTVKPWREDVRQAAITAHQQLGYQLDGPLGARMVFSVRKPASKPTWWPKGVPWKVTLPWRPASAPDLSKLLRSTEDAITSSGLWKDDARVVEYARLAKVFVSEDPEALEVPGVRIAIWQVVL